MLSLRHAAVAAGLGEFGWHSIVITPKYGTRNRFAAILTTAELEPDPLYDGAALCNPKTCGVCSGICPNGCIHRYGDKDPVQVKIGEKTYQYCKFDFDPCTLAGQGVFKNQSDYEERANQISIVRPNNNFFIHFTSWKCGLCMAYCPAGNWMKHFKASGLSRVNLGEYMNGAVSQK